MTKEEALKKIEENEKNISELKEYIEGLEKSKGAWKPRGGQEYWYEDDFGRAEIQEWSGSNIDEYRYLTDNCFKTEEEVEVRIEYKKALGTVTHYILEENGGMPGVCAVYHDSRSDGFYIRDDMCRSYGSPLPDIKSREIADEVISKFDKELRIIFKIK